MQKNNQKIISFLLSFIVISTIAMTFYFIFSNKQDVIIPRVQGNKWFFETRSLKVEDKNYEVDYYNTDSHEFNPLFDNKTSKSVVATKGNNTSLVPGTNILKTEVTFGNDNSSGFLYNLTADDITTKDIEEKIPVKNVQIFQTNYKMGNGEKATYFDDIEVVYFYEYIFNIMNHGPEILDVLGISFYYLKGSPPLGSLTLAQYSKGTNIIDVFVYEDYFKKHLTSSEITYTDKVSYILNPFNHEYGHHYSNIHISNAKFTGTELNGEKPIIDNYSLSTAGLWKDSKGIDRDSCSSEIRQGYSSDLTYDKILNNNIKSCGAFLYNKTLLEDFLEITNLKINKQIYRTNFFNYYSGNEDEINSDPKYLFIKEDFQNSIFKDAFEYKSISNNKDCTLISNELICPTNGKLTIENYLSSYDELLARYYSIVASPTFNLYWNAMPNKPSSNSPSNINANVLSCIEDGQKSYCNVNTKFPSTVQSESKRIEDVNGNLSSNVSNISKFYDWKNNVSEVNLISESEVEKKFTKDLSTYYADISNTRKAISHIRYIHNNSIDDLNQKNRTLSLYGNSGNKDYKYAIFENESKEIIAKRLSYLDNLNLNNIRVKQTSSYYGNTLFPTKKSDLSDNTTIRYYYQNFSTELYAENNFVINFNNVKKSSIVGYKFIGFKKTLEDTNVQPLIENTSILTKDKFVNNTTVSNGFGVIYYVDRRKTFDLTGDESFYLLNDKVILKHNTKENFYTIN
jgi:hypothetical protein